MPRRPTNPDDFWDERAVLGAAGESSVTLLCNHGQVCRWAASLDAMVEHPLVLGLLDRLLEPNYLLSQLQVIDIQPGEAAQALHTDDAIYPWPRPRPPLGVATIIAIDDFTAHNGATRIIPGSHTWDARLPTPREAASAVPAVVPAGSILFFLGTTWHGGGENRTGGARMGVTCQYCAPTCRRQESFLLSVGRERVARSSPHLQRMLGYGISPPFTGFVRGMPSEAPPGRTGPRRSAGCE